MQPRRASCTQTFPLLLAALLLPACARSNEDTLDAENVRLCHVDWTGVGWDTLYITPEDAPLECVTVRFSYDVAVSAALHSVSCDEIGYDRTGTLREGAPRADVDATVVGTVRFGEMGNVQTFDVAVTLDGLTGTRTLRATGTRDTSVENGCALPGLVPRDR